MGAPPPPDAPTPAAQAAVDASLSFEPSPAGASLCGFKFPLFNFNLTLRLPKFPPFSFPPNFMIGLNCDLSNPIDAEFSFGGGRVGSSDPDPDDSL